MKPTTAELTEACYELKAEVCARERDVEELEGERDAADELYDKYGLAGGQRNIVSLHRHLVNNHIVSHATQKLTIKLVQEKRVTLKAELEKARELLGEADQQLIYWWESQHSCPCGARPESPTTHPHVLACPTERALEHARTVLATEVKS